MVNRGEEILGIMKSKIVRYKISAILIFAASFSIILGSLAVSFFPISFGWTIPVFLLSSAALILRSGIVNFGISETAMLLNKQYPPLEESAQLWLRETKSLSVLEKLQLNRLNSINLAIQLPSRVSNDLKSAGVSLAAAILIASAILFIPGSEIGKIVSPGTSSPVKEVNEIILPGIAELRMSILPPAYTGLKQRSQKSFSAAFPAGSKLTWQIRTDRPVSELALILNDRQKIAFIATGSERKTWTLSHTFSASGFYQLSLDGKLSEFYPLTAIPDEPPVVRVLSPERNTTIDFGEPQNISVQVSLLDDYGLSSSVIQATVSSGSGEGVKFKEYSIPFNQTLNGGKKYELQRRIDLRSLGMIPGDELYFLVKVRDSRNQESRSDIHIVSLPDTAELMSLDGLLGGVNLVPEYFRSQRQIIIDSEKLISQKNDITDEEFQKRSNNLGLDQKMLRLRYGKFLGEEAETEIGEGHEEGHEEAGETSLPGNSESIMDSYAHKHDVAEDATFFEPQLKAQLKAVLAEMWKSELQLRTNKPSEALPFEYKALRLLKDLQQQSRVYVAKTSFKPPLIKAEKRLSAELDKITEPRRNTSSASLDIDMLNLRKAVAVLEKLKTNRTADSEEIRILNLSSAALARSAVSAPDKYLKPLAILRDLMRSNFKSGRDLILVQAAIDEIIKHQNGVPARDYRSLDELSERYFKNLDKSGR